MIIVLAGNFKWTDDDLLFFSDHGNNKLVKIADEEGVLPIAEENVDVVIGNWFFKYHKLENFKNLKYIQLLSSGYNGIDPAAVHKMGITLYNAKDVYSIPISEFVICRLLSFYKHEKFFFEKQKEHNWLKLREIEELYGKRVLIIGTGSIGNSIASRIGAFTSEVYGCNRTIRNNSLYREIFPLVDLSKVISSFDIIILSIALTEDTKHLIDSNILNLLTRSNILVNVSRGQCIDESALEKALSLGRLGGAILDVFEDEPLSEHSPLWDLDNVLISPHNAFASNNNSSRLRTVILRNFDQWVEFNGQISKK